MRHRVRHLPAYLGLLLPLAALAWLGSVELSRQTERAEKALADNARTFVVDASRKLEFEIVRATRGVDELFEVAFQPLVFLDQEVHAVDELAKGLIVLDSEGALVYPDTPPPDSPDLPFHTQSYVPDIRAAEQLIALQDFAGARALLEDYLERERPRRRSAIRSNQRARFRLGGILRKLGQPEEAEEQLAIARRGSSRRPDSVALLCDVAVAEIEADRGRGYGAMVDVMERIAGGENWRYVGDGLLAEVMRYLHEKLPPASDAAIDGFAAIEVDRVRRDGRSFARDYTSLRRESVRRQLRSFDGDRLYVLHDTPDGAWLLVLRPIEEIEREQALSILDDAEWIGIRYELADLLGESLERLIEPTFRDFYLAIESQDGSLILPREVPPTPEGVDFLAPRQRSIAGMTLRAEPADPESFMSASRSTARNQALLVIALCVAAGGGALLLVRSVSRESEVASLKLQLVSRISHELKTPLALIKMYGETLARGRANSPEQTQQFTGIITREADRLTAMVERVLDLSRREGGEETDYVKDRTDLSEIVTTVIEAYRPRAASRGIELSTTVHPTLIAFADDGAFENAVLNLIENAVKYTAKDAVEPTVEVDFEESEGRAVLEVRDRGVGIPPKEIGQVFTTFYRASNARETPGAGLGLSLVSDFAAAHDGDVSARAREGGGTTFRLAVPLEATTDS